MYKRQLQLSGLNVVDPVVSPHASAQDLDAASASTSSASGEDGPGGAGSFVKVQRRRAKSADAVQREEPPRTTPGDDDDGDGPIVKSTHMAAFYYRDTPRRSVSDDGSNFF